jgi:hypothetical protein
MFRRLAIAALWFVAFLCLHELAWSVFGSPRALGLAVGGLAAAFFYFDPARLFTWRSTGSVASADRLATAGRSSSSPQTSARL